MVIDIESVVLGEYDIVSALEGTMLEGIVQDHYLHVRTHGLNLLNTFDAIFTHRHTHLRKLQINLHGLVADGLGSGLRVSHDKAFGHTFVAT